LQAESAAIVFHAGTKVSKDRVVNGGGRVLAVTSYGHTIDHALDACYERIEGIHSAGKNYRKDLGKDMAKYMQKA
jgi:phosphoribosylamine-glycine ligase